MKESGAPVDVVHPPAPRFIHQTRNTKHKRLSINMPHHPAIDIAEHVKMETIVGGVGVHRHVKTRGIQKTVVGASLGQWSHRIVAAVADQDSQGTDFMEAEERARLAREESIER